MLDMRGSAALLDLSVSLGEQCAWLALQAPAYLLTYPSNLKALLGHGLAPWSRPRAREDARRNGRRQNCAHAAPSQLGVPLIDEYSAQEIGSIAIQCPLYPHYHVQAEGVHVEVLRDDGSACCAPGDVGRVVVTPLHEFRTPLLRYALGDYAQVGAACDCGRGLPGAHAHHGPGAQHDRDAGRRPPLAAAGRRDAIARSRRSSSISSCRKRASASKRGSSASAT